MNLHEYQAKEILEAAGIAVPPYGVASHKAEVEKIIKDLHLKEAVIKIQVHAGGRGKAGGVKFGKSPDEIKKIAGALIGMKMVNNQTGPAGVVANQVLIAAPLKIAKEYYLGAILIGGASQSIPLHRRKAGWISKRSPSNIRRKF